MTFTIEAHARILKYHKWRNCWTRDFDIPKDAVIWFYRTVMARTNGNWPEWDYRLTLNGHTLATIHANRE